MLLSTTRLSGSGADPSQSISTIKSELWHLCWPMKWILGFIHSLAPPCLKNPFCAFISLRNRPYLISLLLPFLHSRRRLESEVFTMADLEKDHAPGTNGNGNYHMDESIDSETALRKIRTAGSISISPELFEKIYLSPKNQVSNNLRSTFGNPTPLYGCSKI
jgi:hypothetical protein